MLIEYIKSRKKNDKNIFYIKFYIDVNALKCKIYEHFLHSFNKLQFQRSFQPSNMHSNHIHARYKKKMTLSTYQKLLNLPNGNINKFYPQNSSMSPPSRYQICPSKIRAAPEWKQILTYLHEDEPALKAQGPNTTLVTRYKRNTALAAPPSFRLPNRDSRGGRAINGLQ